MYYNMKFKTLKRWINGQLKTAAQSRDDLEQKIFAQLEPLYREMCEIDRVKEEYLQNITPVAALSHSGEMIARPSVEECAQKYSVLGQLETDQVEVVNKIEVCTLVAL